MNNRKISLVLFLIVLSCFSSLYSQIPFSEQKGITDTDLSANVYAFDLDGDGDMDVLSVLLGWGVYKIAWYKNDGSGHFGDQQIITNTTKGEVSIYACDLDEDGDLDVLSASRDDNTIAWYANEGSGHFGNQQIITNTAKGAASVYACDLDEDGDLDVLSALVWDDKIAWYANDGSGHFGDQQIISTAAWGPHSVYACDLDNDGDMDVISESGGDQNIAWYANDGSGHFSRQHFIGFIDYPYSVYAWDLDSDRDLDVLSAVSSDHTIAWYANDGSGHFGNRQDITIDSCWVACVYVCDLDGDRDMDVLYALHSDKNIAWYENDGFGNFGNQQIITTAAEDAHSLYASDLDNDGDMDVLSALSNVKKIVWYENLMSPAAHFSADTLFGAAPLTVQFFDSSRGGRTAWLWDFGDGSTSTEQNPVHTYHTADTFAVSLTVTGKQGSDTETRENYIIVTDPSVITGKGEQVPVSFALSQNYPNPFNPSTQIEYDVKTSCKVNLFIYNLHGQIVKKFVNSLQQPGKYAINVNLQDIPSGIYFYKIVMGDFQAVKKMVKIE